MTCVIRACGSILVAHLLMLPAVGLAQTQDHVVIGIGAVHAPAYQGANDFRTLPLPVIDVVNGPFFANLRNGIGINGIDSTTLTVGGSVTFLPGYRGRDVPNGVGRLSAGVGGRLFANVRAGGLIATLGGTQGLAGGTEGFTADVSLIFPVSVGACLTLIPAMGSSWASAKHNDRYFGVSAGQAGASGLPVFQPGKGFQDGSASLTAIYRATDRISLKASASVIALLGEARKSPIVFHKVQPTIFFSIDFRLGS